MKRLICSFIDNPVAANLLAVFLLLAGVFGLQGMTIKLFPEIATNAIRITVPYPGATPREVEDAIVKPIEESIEGLEGVRKVTSLASSNVASLVIDLKSGASLSTMLDDVQREVDAITVFPLEAEEPQVVEVDPDELIAQVVLYGNADQTTLKKLAQRARDDLAQTADMSDVRVSGVPDYLIDIAVNPETLRAYGLSLGGLARIVDTGSLDLSAGEVEGDNTRTLIRTVGESETGNAFGRIPIVTSDSGSVIRLQDIASIQDGVAESPIATQYQGKSAVILSIYRVGDENVFDIIAATKRYVEETLSPRLDPGISAVLWRDQSEALRGRINLLIKNAAIGIALVLVLLLAFLDLRVAAWVAFGVGLSFIAALIPMAFFGPTINQLSLFGFILAIGIVVDDAIVVGENIYVARKNGAGPVDAAKQGAIRVATPVFIAVLTTMTAFVPLLFVPGTYGEFIGPLVAVVLYVLAFSLVESFFVLPRHLSHLSNDAPARYSPRRPADWIRRKVGGALEDFRDNHYRPVVEKVVLHPAVTLAVAVGIFIASLGLLAGGQVKFIFFPKIEGDYVSAQIALHENASEFRTRDAIEALVEGVSKATNAIDVDDAVVGILTNLGTAPSENNAPTASTSGGAAANVGYVTVRIKDAGIRSFTAKAFEDAWRSSVGDVPGAQKLIFSSDLVSAGAPVAINVSSDSEQTSRAVVKALREELDGMRGVFDIRDDRFRTTNEIRIKLKPQARIYGLTLADLARSVRSAYFGAEAVRIQRDREEIEVRLRLPRDQREAVFAVDTLRIPINGAFVPLEEVATLAIAPAPATITRIDGKRVIALTADIDTAVTTGGNITDALLNQALPPIKKDYPSARVTLGGDQEQQARALPALARNFALALFTIFTLLALVFRSYTQPLVIMTVIPFGFVGALIGHAALGYDLTLLSLFGIIGLSGVIINDGLLMIDFINEKLRDGTDINAAIADSAVARFRPILLTSLTTFLGVAPIILETSVQAQFLIPTAISLGFGILFGTLILALLVPAIARLHLGAKQMDLSARFERLKESSAT